MGKALCECGALTDLDEEVILRKKHLGKSIECIKCRNRRIAEELEEKDQDSEDLNFL